MKKSPAHLRAWTDINSLLRTHKLVNYGLIVICILQVFIIGLIYFGDPVVVLVKGEKHIHFMGKRQHLPITEKDVERFVRKFLRLRYEWQELSLDEKKKTLAPVVTDGLGKKLEKLLKRLKTNEFQGKRTQQSIVNVDVSVTKEKVIASFDKLLKIEGLPIPVPTTLSLSISKGAPNQWNPIGLFVNGIIENQLK